MAFSRNSLKKELYLWSKRTRLPAIPNIADSKTSLAIKLIWTFFIILFSIILSQKISFLITSYFKYEKLTNLQIKTIQNETDFPVVTIKFLNWLNYDHFISKILTDQEEYFSTHQTEDLNEDFQSARNKFLSTYLMSSLNLKERLMLETELAQNSLISCRFNGLKCSVDDFKLQKYENDGAFISFNMEKRKMNKKSSLELELFVGASETQSPLERQSGAVLFIHDDPRLVIMPDEQGIELKPGTHSSISITKQVVKNLPEPFNRCVTQSSQFNSSLYEMTISLTGFYSQKYCFELCFQESMIKNCGCYDESLIRYINYKSSLSSCSEKFSFNQTFLNDEDYLISCPSFIREAFYMSDYVTKCSDLCPRECENTYFKTSISRSKYPSQFYSNILRNNKKVSKLYGEHKSRLNDSLVAFKITFASDYFIEIEQVPAKTLIDLVSELGDNLGLFLGLSILSVVEIADILIKILIILSQRIILKLNQKYENILDEYFKKFVLRCLFLINTHRKNEISKLEFQK